MATFTYIINKELCSGIDRDQLKQKNGRELIPSKKLIRLFSIVIKFVDFIPVNNIPECLEVFRTFVLILQIVSVLPDINAEDWSFTFRYRVVLVRSRNDFKFTVVYNKPCPA